MDQKQIARWNNRALVLGWLKSQVKEATTGIDATSGRVFFHGGKTRAEWIAYKALIEDEIKNLEEIHKSEQEADELATQAQTGAEES